MGFNRIATQLTAVAANPVTATVTSTAGRLLLAYCWSNAFWGTNGGNTDQNVNNWTKVDANAQSQAFGIYTRVSDGSSNDNLTLQFSTARDAGIVVYEFDDAVTGSPIDLHQVSAASGTGHATTANGARTFTASGPAAQADEYVFAALVSDLFNAAWTTGSAIWGNGYADAGNIPEHYTSGAGGTLWVGSKTLTAIETPSTSLIVASAGSDGASNLCDSFLSIKRIAPTWTYTRNVVIGTS